MLTQHQMERLTDKELLDKHRTFRCNQSSLSLNSDCHKLYGHSHHHDHHGQAEHGGLDGRDPHVVPLRWVRHYLSYLRRHQVSGNQKFLTVSEIILELQGVPVACPTCDKEFCSLCSAAWHPGLSCAEHGAALVVLVIGIILVTAFLNISIVIITFICITYIVTIINIVTMVSYANVIITVRFSIITVTNDQQVCEISLH